ncbi:MAG: hypothetical protein A2725_03055 [Candidatus Magasanikbacteria bacterium RIFCSPHIGHO2_01_FULL_33_34]|uniref:Peptidase C51 domain-containing protein n=1 Tax=Candidatus Magasanikbacteria bacterium RIFCSPHIGHO2_01_FULL_33_34 TaxID=1798671 RepID=A0A1F6LGX7_9BACT|nr:MAG: hypothetical protein A2725_03055 [Candidatus Magasanikbacteria bacterium RIFCSPHIGHO2_01_FULL_33_34]OGH66111.1 MAG: hypothetical protein A3B83_00545 [Candidatus Magasanikbacteria bacterium RIFCSPHIGHO2_02_FULL_33_17]OGH75957.1 MAG: hypothetical protein A3A89_00455 [Candidatus Magasanikbacteria bacterium RIFCSPLOWO2_01_FULL_33_34]
MKKRFIFLLVLYLTVLYRSNVEAKCVQGDSGGQCVSFVRTEFGGSYETMPALGATGLARQTWNNWDLWFGSGQIPHNNSIMVLDAWGSNTAGHVAVVISSSNNTGGTYNLVVDESNWDNDDRLMDCGVNYTFYPNDSEVTRNGYVTRYPVLGFIYGQEVTIPDPTPSTTHFCDSGLTNTGSPNWEVICNQVPTISGTTSSVFSEGQDIILNAKFTNVYGTKYLNVYVEKNGVLLQNIEHNIGPYTYSGNPYTAFVNPIVRNASLATSSDMTPYRFMICVRDTNTTYEDCKANSDLVAVAWVIASNSEVWGTVETASEVGGYTNICTSEYTCSLGQGHCEYDTDCESNLVCLIGVGAQYGYDANTNVCEANSSPITEERNTTGLNGDSRYCVDFGLCSIGYGNCNTDNECQSNLICDLDRGGDWNLPGWVNVCVQYRGQTYNNLVSQGLIGGNPNLLNGDVNFCSQNHPCTEGQGDCDDTTQCVEGLFCEGNAGDRFGLPVWVNICVDTLIGFEAQPSGLSQEALNQITRYSEKVSVLGRYLLFIPSGTFVKGASTYDQAVGADKEEKPAQSVEITFDFYIDKHEATEGDWKEKFNNISPSNNGDDHPVTGISIWDAFEYANRTSEFEGLNKCYILNNCSGIAGNGMLCSSVGLTTQTPQDCEGYMLPTSAMWEYTARAGTTTSFWAGNLATSYSRNLDTGILVEDISWFADNSGGVSHPVCSVNIKHPSGVCDMHGNAAEWVLGDYRDLPTTTPVTNPFSLPTSGVCEYRGGNYNSEQPYQLRSFRKGGGDCDSDWFTWRDLPSYKAIGVRLARVSVPDISISDIYEQISPEEETVQTSTPTSLQRAIKIEYSGVGLRLNDTDHIGLDITNNLTVELWYQPTAQPDYNTASVLVRKNDAYVVVYEDYGGTKKLTMYMWGNYEKGWRKDFTLENNTWYHLAWSYNANIGTVNLYVDAYLEGTDNSFPNQINNSNGHFQISEPFPGYQARGVIDEVRIWNTIRTEQEIITYFQTELTGSESNLVGYWNFNDTITDSTNNTNDLNWTGGGAPVFVDSIVE